VIDSKDGVWPKLLVWIDSTAFEILCFALREF
jgi:hypothetical protein